MRPSLASPRALLSLMLINLAIFSSTGPAASLDVTRYASPPMYAPKIFGSLDMATGTAPNLQAKFIGSGLPGLFKLNVISTAAHQTVPEISLQSAIYSNIGNGDKNAYKVGGFFSALGGPNSAPVYALNSIVQGHAGAGGYLLTGYESDLNSIGQPAGELGSDTAANALVAVAAGTTSSTAGLWVVAAVQQASFKYGVALTFNAATLAGFFDGSTSTSVLRVENTHITLVDALNATIQNGLAVNNNVNTIIQRDAGGTPRVVFKIDGGSVLQIGNSSLPAVELNAPLKMMIDGAVRSVSRGPADSCGTGFTCLRVPN